MTSLPTPRALLTALLNSLTTTPPSTAPTTTTNTTNPLKSLPPSHRALLTTLHVLFPPPMLLQALDLLDRGLVTRFIQTTSTAPPPPPESETEKERAKENEVKPPQAHVHLPSSPHSPLETPLDREEGTGKDGDTKTTNAVYLVRSSQTPRSRFKSGHGGGNESVGSAAGSMVYTVRPEAWNCSCAAFAFAAFPGGSGSWDSGAEEGQRDEVDGEESRGMVREWEFGGLSFDGMDLGKGDAGNVPICKHLLACLLGERWEDVLGSYVKVREVGREEMAGMGGEG